MMDFEKEEKEIKKKIKIVFAMVIVVMITFLALIGFFVWVIVKFMQHNGIV